MAYAFRRSYRGPLKAVILDWAGTTVDYGSCAPALVFVEVFRRAGVQITMEQARGPMGMQKRAHIEVIAQMPAVARAWQQQHGRTCSQEDIDRMYEEFIPLQLQTLADFADLIPGTLDAAADFRRRGLKIGTTTGYNREMTDIVVSEAAKRGFRPDAVVCASEVPAGRPAPWMALRAVMEMGVYPMEACVKIGDTVPDVEEGLNAGMWSVGVAVSGNEIGLSQREVEALSAEEFKRMRAAAYAGLSMAGAHYVVDSVADVPGLLDEIGRRVSAGEKP